MVRLIDESIDQGMHCLKALDGAGSRKNHHDLTELFKEKKIVYHCNETEYNWKGLAAHASYTPAMDKQEYGLIHPYVSIFPDFVLGDSTVKGEVMSEDFLKDVIFHEHFHTIGYLHNSSVDYAYTCEDCCFYDDRAIEKSHRDISCKICKSSYEGIQDPVYIDDIWKWTEKAQWKGVKRSLLIRVAIFRSQNKKMLWPYFFREKIKNNIIHKFLAKKLIKSGITSKEIVAASKVKLPEGSKDLETLAQSVASLELMLYEKQDLKKTVMGFMNLDTKALKFQLRLNPKRQTPAYLSAVNLWDEILYDLDMLYIQHANRDPAIIEMLDLKYNEISKIKPSR